MSPVNILEAKSTLSRLVEAVESGKESEIIIARNGKPVARLVPLATARPGQRIGLLEGRFVAASDEEDARADAEIAKLFHDASPKP